MLKIRRLLTTGLVTALLTIVVPAVPAHAGIWHEYPPSANRTCSETSVYNGVAHQICLEYNDNRTQVRAVAFVNPGAYTSYQVNLELWFGSGLHIPESCPTITTNASRACYTGWTTVRRPYLVADATFGVAGNWLKQQRAVDTALSGKYQERYYWCAPAALQTIVATMGLSAPSQEAAADYMNTNPPGTPIPNIPIGINHWVPSEGWRYFGLKIPDDGPDRKIGLDALAASIARGRPAIAVVDLNQLPWYTDSAEQASHVIVLHGYGGLDSPLIFKVWDPSSGGGEHVLTVPQLFAAAEGIYSGLDGVYVITS